MKDFSTIEYFPKNRKSQELYKYFSTIMDKSIEVFFSDTYLQNRYMFDPSTDNYDADYVLSITIGKDIAKLLLNQPYEVRKSLSLIYPGLIKARGTESSIHTFLGLIDIDFIKIVYIKQKNGCTNATIVLKPGVILDSGTEKLLIEITKRLLPICVKLLGVTNCPEDNDEDYDVGQHLLSVNFRLSKSKLSSSQGKKDENGLIINNCKLK